MNYRFLKGVVHGNTIELHEATGVSDGEEVEVVVRPASEVPLQPGRGFISTEGALADDPEWDAIMQEIQDARRSERASRYDAE